MKYHDVFVKNKFDSSKPEPARIFAPNQLSDSILKMIGNMTYEEASSYCRNALGASVMRGHPGKTNE